LNKNRPPPFWQLCLRKPLHHKHYGAMEMWKTVPYVTVKFSERKRIKATLERHRTQVGYSRSMMQRAQVKSETGLRLLRKL